MIQTNVKAVGANEHEVRVQLPKSEYDRVYAAQLQKLAQQVKMPGFRSGKTPSQVIQKQFGPKLHEDTVSELVQTYYVQAIESSGLVPAVQPYLDIPAVQPEAGFAFTLKVTTWPEIELKDLSKLKFDVTDVTVDDSDVKSVVDRLMDSQVHYEVVEDRQAEKGDQLHIDFTGYVDGVAFEGGKGENVALVLGEGRFIPGFEDQLIGKKAGEACVVMVTFPAEYQAAHLAGKPARFETTVRSVGKAVKAKDAEELAKMLGFDDAAAFRADVKGRLEQEAEQGAQATTREAALVAMLEANPLDLPEALLAQDMRDTTQRVVQNMQRQGIQVTREMFEDEAFRNEVRSRSEKGLKLSVLLQAVRKLADVSVDEAELDAEIDRQAKQYPAEQQVQYRAWIRGQKEQLEGLREMLLERKCIAYIVSKAKAKAVSKSLSAWQSEQEQG